MELFSNDSLWGICFFLMGMVTLEKCRSLDQKHHYTMRKLRRMEWYGRREADTKATLPLTIRGCVMTSAGAALSLYGIIRFLGSVL